MQADVLGSVRAALTMQLLINPELDPEADAQQGIEDISDSRHEGSSGDAL